MHEDLQRGKALITRLCPLRTHTQRVLAVPDGSTVHSTVHSTVLSSAPVPAHRGDARRAPSSPSHAGTRRGLIRAGDSPWAECCWLQGMVLVLGCFPAMG